MKIGDALSPGQRQRLSELAASDPPRTNERELLRIAVRLEEYDYHSGTLSRIRRGMAEILDGSPESAALERLAEAVNAWNDPEVISDSICHITAMRLSPSEYGDPTCDQALGRVQAQERWRKIFPRMRGVADMPSSLFWSGLSIRAALNSAPGILPLLAVFARTTSEKLIEVLELAEERKTKALMEGRALRLIEERQDRPWWARHIRVEATASRPGQDVYAKRSRTVSMGTGSPEELEQTAMRAEEIAHIDEEDAGRLAAKQHVPDLDQLELKTMLEKIVRDAGITVSQIKSRSRETELAKARRNFVVLVAPRARPKQIADTLGRSRQYVERVLIEEGLTCCQ